MKVKYRFDSKDQKIVRSMFKDLQRELGPQKYDASKLPVNWAEHGRIRDLLVLNHTEKEVGMPFQEKFKNDRFFVCDTVYLSEECVLPILSPSELFSQVDLIGKSTDETLNRLSA